MNAEQLAALAATNRWLVIWPELAVAGLALGLLCLDLLLPEARRRLVGTLAVAGQMAVAGVLLAELAFGDWTASHFGVPQFGGLLLPTASATFFRLLFLLASALTCHFGAVFLEHRPLARGEFHFLVLVGTAALMLLAQASHFVSLFVALETVTVCLYVLVAYVREHPLSLEAGLKYLVLGALSSALLLFGVALLYGLAGTPGTAGWTDQGMQFAALAGYLAAHPTDPVVLLAVALILAGVGFKIGAFPFQIWIPDVYQGAPTPVTAYLAVASKGAGFAVLMNLLLGPFRPLDGTLVPVLSAAAAATILFGNLAALPQRNLKRLMGLSGISHAGFLLMGVTAMLVPTAPAWTQGAVLFYLAAYLLATMAVFGVLTYAGGADDTTATVEHYDEFARRQPFLAGVLVIGIGSLAGVPPLAGFIGKLLVFIAAAGAGLYGLLVIGALGAALSIYYYFGWMRAAWFEAWRLPGDEPPAPAPNPAPGFGGRVTLVLLCAATILLGFVQGPLGGLL